MSIRKQTSRANNRSVLSAAIFESLESRRLMSGDLPAINSPLAGALTPAQVRTAYGVNLLGIANQGQGVTIAIVDELDDPNITADTNAFSAEYGLPRVDGIGGDPLLTVAKDTALASVGSGSGTGVAAETSLDVEWAHAMAPKANILLEEVPATGTAANEFAELLHGVQVAAGVSGVVVVSLSYGYPEASIGASSVVSENSTYLATGAASNIAVAVSTGDGSTPLFPATSPYVTAVGGTSLYLASVKGNYSYETAWGGLAGEGAGGGGTSTNFATPTFQSNNGVNIGSKRSIPDVSLVADPVTAVSIYDSLDSSTSPWTEEGGTSVATPIFAGIVSLAQQNRVAAGLAPLTSVQIDNEMYTLYNSPSYSTFFHDIALGSNKNANSRGTTTVTGFPATTGYDEATGLGSPIANMLIPNLSALIPSPTQTVRLTNGAVLNSKLSSTSLDAASAAGGTVSLYDLLPAQSGSGVSQDFVQAVAQAQQSPVISWQSGAFSMDDLDKKTLTKLGESVASAIV